MLKAIKKVLANYQSKQAQKRRLIIIGNKPMK